MPRELDAFVTGPMSVGPSTPRRPTDAQFAKLIGRSFGFRPKPILTLKGRISPGQGEVPGFSIPDSQSRGFSPCGLAARGPCAAPTRPLRTPRQRPRGQGRKNKRQTMTSKQTQIKLKTNNKRCINTIFNKTAIHINIKHTKQIR